MPLVLRSISGGLLQAQEYPRAQLPEHSGTEDSECMPLHLHLAPWAPRREREGEKVRKLVSMTTREQVLWFPDLGFG